MENQPRSAAARLRFFVNVGRFFRFASDQDQLIARHYVRSNSIGPENRGKGLVRRFGGGFFGLGRGFGLLAAAAGDRLQDAIGFAGIV